MRDERLILKLLKRDEKKSASEYNAPVREPIQVEAQMKKVKASEESGTSQEERYSLPEHTFQKRSGLHTVGETNT